MLGDLVGWPDQPGGKGSFGEILDGLLEPGIRLIDRVASKFVVGGNPIRTRSLKQEKPKLANGQRRAESDSPSGRPAHQRAQRTGPLHAGVAEVLSRRNKRESGRGYDLRGMMKLQPGIGQLARRHNAECRPSARHSSTQYHANPPSQQKYLSREAIENGVPPGIPP